MSTEGEQAARKLTTEFIKTIIAQRYQEAANLIGDKDAYVTKKLAHIPDQFHFYGGSEYHLGVALARLADGSPRSVPIIELAVVDEFVWAHVKSTNTVTLRFQLDESGQRLLLEGSY